METTFLIENPSPKDVINHVIIHLSPISFYIFIIFSPIALCFCFFAIYTFIKYKECRK